MSFFGPALKFVVTRPIVIPVATVGVGLSYGCFDLTKSTTRAILGRKSTRGTMLSYCSSVVIYGGTIVLRNLTSPHEFTVMELVKQNRFRELMVNSRALGLYYASSLAAAGVFSGAAYAYFSE